MMCQPFPGQPISILDNFFGEEIIPTVQSKPHLVQLEGISSHPVPCYLGEVIDPTCLQLLFR